MKSRFSAFILLVCLVSCAVFAGDGKAVVRAVRGTAYYDVDGKWKKLEVGRILNPGAKVRTESASQVDLFLDRNGPVVRVMEQSILGLDKLYFESNRDDVIIETQLNLIEGRILGSVKKMASASKYEVKTPAGIAGIRGTDYDISANGSIRVIQGSVVFVTTGPDGKPETRVIMQPDMDHILHPADPVPIKVEPIPPQVLVEMQLNMPKYNQSPLPDSSTSPWLTQPGFMTPFPQRQF